MDFVTCPKPLKIRHTLMTSSKFYHESWKLFVSSSRIKIDFVNSTKNGNNNIKIYYFCHQENPHV